MFISTALFVSHCLILFCIICGMCKITKQTETETETSDSGCLRRIEDKTEVSLRIQPPLIGPGPRVAFAG